MKFYYVTNIFDLHTVDNETTTFLKFFEISTEMHFVSLLFLNKRNVATSLLITEYYSMSNFVIQTLWYRTTFA